MPPFFPRFYAAVSLNKHIKSVHGKKDVVKKNPEMFKCGYCPVSFPHKFSLVKHLESAHDIAPKRDHTCEECGKSFSTPSSLKTHVNKGKKTIFFLKISDIKFWKYKKFPDHPSEETLNQIECKCDQCDKNFNTALELNQHLTIIHLREDTLTCDRCQTKWASTSVLQKHIAEIHKALVFPCELCGRTFRCRYTMTAHVREVHQKTDEYPCDR